jgi:hypothetical protein
LPTFAQAITRVNLATMEKAAMKRCASRWTGLPLPSIE